MLQGRCSFLMTFARNGWSSNWAVMGWAIVECVASGADGTNSGGGMDLSVKCSFQDIFATIKLEEFCALLYSCTHRIVDSFKI